MPYEAPGDYGNILLWGGIVVVTIAAWAVVGWLIEHRSNKK